MEQGVVREAREIVRGEAGLRGGREHAYTLFSVCPSLSFFVFM
jgi:hypothetical protein